jgi:hypothetical protein
VPGRTFADAPATAPAYRCLTCGYVLDAEDLDRLPACPRCSHGDWMAVEPAEPEPGPAATAAQAAERTRGPLMVIVRYVIPGVLCLAGLVVLAVNPGGFGVEGFGLFCGAGLSILLLNVLFRVSVSGDLERSREQDARDFYARHGRWPDEERRAPRR